VDRWLGDDAEFAAKSSKAGLTVEKTGHTAKETGTIGASRP